MAEMKVGDLVREARTRAGLTQEKLAAQVGGGLQASDIGKCERKQADLTKEQLKKIAVACGVSQASLVNAPKNLPAADAKSAAKTTAAKTAAKTTAAKTAPKTTTAKTAAKTTAKTTSAKTAAAKTAAKTTTAKTAAKTTAARTTEAKTAAKATAAKTTAAKTTAAKKTAEKKTTATGTSMKVSSAEKKLIEAYREASAENKKTALNVLKGEYSENALRLLNLAGGEDPASSVGDASGSFLSDLTGGLF